MINPFDNEEIVNKKDSERTLPLTINLNTQDKLDSLPVQNSYQNEYEVHKDEGAYIPTEAKPVPGFVETMKHAMPFMQGLAATNDMNPLSDTTPDGYNAASDDSNFIGIKPRYQGHIAKGSSPNDTFFRRLQALDQQEQDEYFENGSLLAKFTGGFVDSLPFALIPLGQAAKYATLSKTLFEGTLAAAPGLAVGSLLHEGSVQAHDIGGNIEETLLNTYIDTIGGLAFIGAGEALGHGFNALKLYDARNMMKLHYDGINADIKIDGDGKVLGYVATGMRNESISAAKYDAAQKFLDSSFSQNGLFAIPYIGGFLGKGAAKVNPIIRGLTSPFETVRGFTDRVSSHSLITEGIEKGIAKPEDFESLMGIVQGQNKMYYNTMQSLLDKRNDIDSKSAIVNLGERTMKKWKDSGYTDAEKFGSEIKQVILSGNSSEHGAVNEAAAVTKAYLDDTWNLYRETYGLPKDWTPPPTADGYFPRVYNTGLMMERPEQWQNMWVSWWKEADSEINTLSKPLNDFRESMKQAKTAHEALIKDKNATEEQHTKSKRELAAMNRRLRTMKEDLANQIKGDKRLFLHGEDHAALSGNEARSLRKTLKPLNQAKRELDAQKKLVQKLTQEKFFAENKVTSAASKEKAKKLQADLKKLESELVAHKEELKAREGKHLDEEDKLQVMASEGKISPRLYDRIPDSNRVKFRNPRNLMKFRKTFFSEHEMRQQADALRTTILNQTPEDTLQQVLGHYRGSASENPTLKRTQMIPDESLQANNFLSNNLPMVVSNYRNALHRKINMKAVFGDVTPDGGIAPIVERLTKEFKDKETALILNKNLDEKDKAKAIKKLNKQFSEAKEFMNLSFDRMMGRTRGSEGARKFSKIMKLWTVSTRLGSVPLAMITDLSANVYKHGFWPSIRDGLLPALENVASILKKPEGKAYIENAAHAHLGLNTTLAAYNDRDWGGIAMQQVPMTGTLGNFMEHAAHISGNIALTNHLENFLQRVTANITQSKIMKYLMDFEKGVLKPKDRDKLLKYGLQPEQWSERFLKGWRERGSDGNGFGGYQSRYFEWADAEASNKMASTIYKSVNDTIIRKGMMDAPFFFDDPILGMISFLHGWSSAALTRYLAPLMQRPDAEHLIGLVTMLAAGSLVAPMRKISKGESPIDDETNMFWDAAQDSGILSPFTGLIEDANILTHGRILRGISNDRYRQRSELSAALGPIFGVGQDAMRSVGMMLDGQLNETDLKKTARLIPGMQPWFLKGMQNKMIESLGLPKNATEAQNGSGNAYR